MTKRAITVADAAILSGFSPELLLKCTSYAPKPGTKRKLAFTERDGIVLFDAVEVTAFKEFLAEPWPAPKEGRPPIPTYISDDVKDEAHHACAICDRQTSCEVAHIEPVSKTWNNSPDNLLFLCASHHTDYDHGFKVKSSIDEDVVRSAKTMVRDARRRMLLYEANTTSAFLSLLEQIAELDARLKKAVDPDGMQALTSALRRSMSRLPEVRKAAAAAATKDERFTKADAATAALIPEIEKLTRSKPSRKRTAATPGLSGRLVEATRGLKLDSFAPVPCPVCEGTGAHLGRPCSFCDGDGKVDPGILERDIDLSAFEPTKCPVCEGTTELLGRPCPFCDGEGKVEARVLERDDLDLSAFEAVRCPACKGKGSIGSRPCGLCDGERKVLRSVADDEDLDLSRFANAPCPLCEGKGTRANRPCSFCEGDGVLEAHLADDPDIDFSRFVLVKCPDCHGRGTRSDNVCRRCEGSGRVERRTTDYD